MPEKFKPTQLHHTIKLMHNPDKHARMVAEYWQHVIRAASLKRLIGWIEDGLAMETKSSLPSLKKKYRLYNELIASVKLSLDKEGVDPADPKWNTLVFAKAAAEKAAKKAAKEAKKKKKAKVPTEEEVYERMCKGCPNEKRCHDECDHCADYLNAFVVDGDK